MRYTDPRQWASLMGRDLEKADLQPIAPMNDGADLRIGGQEDDRTLTLVIQEHLPDVLGPRFLDELRGDLVVRHAIPGPARNEWTADRIRELEGLLCAQPFRLDPVAAIADGDSWVGWMTRNRVLRRPVPGDEAVRRPQGQGTD